MKSEEKIKAERDERRKSKVREKWYLPFTWVPPVVETHLDAKGRAHTTIKRHGYFKLTYKPGTVFISGDKEYKVQENGSLKRSGINRAERRRDKNSHKKGVKV